MSGLAERFDAVRERLERAVLRSGRAPGSVALVAVSKTYGAEAVAELARYRASGTGARPLFGESYMQEAAAKMPRVAELLAPNPAPGWHFIGGLQSRKARDAVGRFELIHSLDSVKLAGALQKAWEKKAGEGRSVADGTNFASQKALIQVNVGREPQKSGVDPAGLEALLNAVAPLTGLRIAGLMCVPPAARDGEDPRRWFALLRSLRDGMEKRCGLSLPVLSMGMSDDFEEAVEEGATLVRVGSLIFGPRTRV
ncbi:MAG: YggS family pyridoxal phosphate-dependent enzyme [Desulfovibrio sp.]|jgi:pyridoxal phosphate enzyme (YggS family)|nr:YggS family pyridoxal phosphate-dependent enzyme [Desulfovibrio sp.]